MLISPGLEDTDHKLVYLYSNRKIKRCGASEGMLNAPFDQLATWLAGAVLYFALRPVMVCLWMPRYFLSMQSSAFGLFVHSWGNYSEFLHWKHVSHWLNVPQARLWQHYAFAFTCSAFFCNYHDWLKVCVYRRSICGTEEGTVAYVSFM